MMWPAKIRPGTTSAAVCPNRLLSCAEVSKDPETASGATAAQECRPRMRRGSVAGPTADATGSTQSPAHGQFGPGTTRSSCRRPVKPKAQCGVRGLLLAGRWRQRSVRSVHYPLASATENRRFPGRSFRHATRQGYPTQGKARKHAIRPRQASRAVWRVFKKWSGVRRALRIVGGVMGFSMGGAVRPHPTLIVSTVAPWS